MKCLYDRLKRSRVYVCLFFSDLTWIHRHCVNTKETDLYVWTWKVNTAAPRSVTGISYKADNCDSVRKKKEKIAHRGRARTFILTRTETSLKTQQVGWNHRNNSQDLGDTSCFKEVAVLPKVKKFGRIAMNAEKRRRKKTAGENPSRVN